MSVYIYLGMKRVVVFALPILIMFPFRKQLLVSHCCLDSPEVPSELHHGECSLQVSFTLAMIVAVCNPGRVTWSLVLFLLAWSLYAKIAVLVLSSSFASSLHVSCMPSALSCASFCIGLRQICCTLIGLNKILVKTY